jgi:hypothetical protein
VQLTARLLAVLAVTAAAGFGAAFAVARSGSGGDDGGATAAPARTTLPSVAATQLDQTVRGLGAAAALPDLRRRPRAHTQTTKPPPTTTQPPPTTTQPPPPPPTTTQQYRPPPTTTQSAPPPVTTSG